MRKKTMEIHLEPTDEITTIIPDSNTEVPARMRIRL